MKLLRFLGCAVIITAAVAFAPSRAQANVFCPVTIDAVENLAVLGRADTYGILLRFDPGDTSSVRVRIDSTTTRYALDFNQIEMAGGLNLMQKRYFVLPEGEHLTSAWIESTGNDANARLACPITQPFDVTQPIPQNAEIAMARDMGRRIVRDAFSTRTPTVKPTAFGAAVKPACAQPFAPARELAPAAIIYPPEARAVRAVGITTVRVDLDDKSTVVGTAVFRSSGYAPLDRAARDAAAKSSYQTETFACRAVASSYLLAIPFNGP